MKFGDVPLAEAEGAILAHSIRLPGVALKKGRTLAREDVAALRAAGRDRVVAARLEPDELAENEAAGRIGAACGGANVRLEASFAGRSNLRAAARGVAVIDEGRVERINLIDETATLATLRPYEPVERGQIVATAKIIAFGVPLRVVEACLSLAAETSGVVRVAAFEKMTVGLIQTRLPGTRESVLDSTTGAVSARLAGLEGTLAAEVRCAHERREVAEAIARLRARGCDTILVAGASAIVDRRDVVPAAVVEAGGAIDHFGMPVDPGNLLLLARSGPARVLGLPGCARSLKLNGFDWVLRRIFAGVEVGAADVMRMGAGGLLTEIPNRPQPRAPAAPKAGGGDTAAARAEPRIAALVLAAGESRRMGARNKLLIEVDGAPMVRRVVAAALASRAAPVLVVTGHEAGRVREALAGLDVAFAHNPDHAGGMSGSLRRGLAALGPEPDGVAICLGDMPRTDAATIDRLIAGFDPAAGRAIGVPTWRGKRGNPVLWAARYFDEIRRIAGDVGARHLIGDHAEAVYEVESPDRSVTVDVDTPEALDDLARAAAP